uniref:Pleckstrin homology like domain family A member 2 n=1 Tax=Homo sapiens TaxID=9606 RepID=A0ABB0MVG5_HUMAN
MKSPDEVLREGELEKRSDSLFQLWKKKRGVLTSDRLSLFPASPRARPKELRFHSILKVDCVERTGKAIRWTSRTEARTWPALSSPAAEELPVRADPRSVARAP